MCVKEMERESVKEGYRESVWLKKRERESVRVNGILEFVPGWGSVDGDIEAVFEAL